VALLWRRLEKSRILDCEIPPWKTCWVFRFSCRQARTGIVLLFFPPLLPQVLHHPAHLEKFPPLTSVIAADEPSQKVPIITRSEPPTRLLYYPVQAISKADPTTLSLTFPLHTRRPRDSILREIQKSSAFPSTCTYCGTVNKGLNIEISGSLFCVPVAVNLTKKRATRRKTQWSKGSIHNYLIVLIEIILAVSSARDPEE